MSLTTITRSKPFYVVAGATDLAVKTLRSVPAKLTSLSLPTVERRDVEKAVATVQVQAVALPMRAQATAASVAGEVTGRVDAAYDELLTRGRKVVGRVRRQQSTQDLKREATTTVRRTKATATTAKKSVSETGTAAKRATKRTSTTAKKRATATRSTAKGAVTAARKTTTSARKATKAGATKVGR